MFSVQTQMSIYGDDDPYKVERGYKTDSYILAVQGNPLEVQTSGLPTTSTNIPSHGHKTYVPLPVEPKISSSREVYEAYIVRKFQ